MIGECTHYIWWKLHLKYSTPTCHPPPLTSPEHEPPVWFDSHCWTSIDQGLPWSATSKPRPHNEMGGGGIQYDRRNRERVDQEWFWPSNEGGCPWLLIVDGHSSHFTQEFLEYAKDHDLHVLCLPPHTTHTLQSKFYANLSSVQVQLKHTLEHHFSNIEIKDLHHIINLLRCTVSSEQSHFNPTMPELSVT